MVSTLCYFDILQHIFWNTAKGRIIDTDNLYNKYIKYSKTTQIKKMPQHKVHTSILDPKV